MNGARRRESTGSTAETERKITQLNSILPLNNSTVTTGFWEDMIDWKMLRQS